MLELHDLRRTYGTTLALNGLHARFPAGSLVGFLGPNGAGKTTTMRIVMGLEIPDAGEVLLDGRPLDAELRRRAGYLPEERGLYPKMAVGRQIELFARLHGVEPAEARRRTDEWLERVGLEDRRDAPVQALSLGNQQRIQLVVALVHQPDLLLLDEPFSGLDPIGTDLMRDLLLERARAGATVVFSSHQLDLVENICDDVVIIHQGQQVLAGAVDDLRASGPRRYAVRAADGWVPTTEGTTVVGRDDRRSLTIVELQEQTDPQLVLADALRAGPVDHFSTERASLSEVFRRAVGA